MASETDVRPRKQDAAQVHPSTVRNDLRTYIGHYPHLGLEALASLKLTVALFAMSIFLIFAGTLAQVGKDVSGVLTDYFYPWFAFIDFQIFLPPTFFPSRPEVSGGFWFPGGALIGTALFANLIAAHMIRFRIQSRGTRLWAGIGVIGLGALITWLVIQSGSNPEGFQTNPIVEWGVLWKVLKYALGLLWVGMASSLLKIKPERKLERWTIVGLTLMLGVALVALFLAGDDARPKPEAMRILWQLIKAGLAAGVLLAGCIMVFKKRGGIVLLHAGVGLMMLSQLLVAWTAKEAQMPINEGETVNWVQDGQHFELAVIDPSSKTEDVVVAIPEAILKDAAATGDVIADDRLPFDVRVVKLLPNSELSDVAPDEVKPDYRGAAKFVGARVRDSSTGTDTDSKFDMASAYLELLDRQTGKSLGTYFVSQFLLEQEVPLGAKTCRIALRAKRTYKSYSMHLIDARGENYLGTSIARNYSSDIHLVDEKRKQKRKVHIAMNDPLRYAGETFYQSNYGKQAVFDSQVDDETGLKTGIPVARRDAGGRPIVKEYSVLQVVTNTGWMMPYVACVIVVFGMLSHFWTILLRFLSRRAAGQVGVGKALTLAHGGKQLAAPRSSANDRARREAAAFAAPDDGSWTSFLRQDRAAVWLPLAVGVLVAGWLCGKLYRAASDREPESAMHVKALGKIPTVADGRVKPLDSLARETLRSLSTKEALRISKDEELPAIVWLADHITRPEKADRYRVFRVTNREVLALLGLPHRSGWRYSYQEIVEGGDAGKPNGARIEEQRRLALKKGSKERNIFERKLLDLYSRIQVYWSVRYSHVVPPADVRQSQVELLESLLEYAPQMRSGALTCPLDDGQGRHWQALTVPATRMWVRRYAAARDLKNDVAVLTDLARYIETPEIRRILDKHILHAVVAEFRRRLPGIAAAGATMSDREIERQIRRISQEAWSREYLRFAIPMMRRAYDDVMQGESLTDPDPPQVVALAEVFSAYREGDSKAFNDAVAGYRDWLAENEPDRYDAAKVGFESEFNQFSPFWNAGLMYLAAFVLAALAWLGWSRPLNRTALCLIGMAFVIHTAALISRMYITGRWGVTVTNLYSSAIFIGWAACLLGIVLEVTFRIGIGNVVASVTGFAALLIAHFLSFEGDTMKVLQAVLDTNFWLATHVTTVTLGYATTFVAWALGLLYIGLGVFSRSLDKNMGRVLTRMIYGTLCFAIFFSFVGTVLGGLWADDSWGRFWGWDPKENGALIIVLWNALVLHARWGGLVKERGLAVLAVVGSIVTSWSWFGVNLLSVGLHTYGFKDGLATALMIFVASQIAVIGIGCIPKDYWASFRQGDAQAA